jgi:hypothetical protein
MLNWDSGRQVNILKRKLVDQIIMANWDSNREAVGLKPRSGWSPFLAVGVPFCQIISEISNLFQNFIIDY